MKKSWLPGGRIATDNPGARRIDKIEKGTLYDTAVMNDGTRVNANRFRYEDGGIFSGLNPWAVPTDEFNSIDPQGLLRKGTK